MPRILHLLESLSQPPPPALLALLADVAAADKDNRHELWTLGPATDPNTLRRFGLPLARQVHWPSAKTWPLAACLLRRHLAGEAGFDRLLAWSALAGAIGALAAPGRTVVASCLPGRPGPLARRVLHRQRVPCLALTADGHDALAASSQVGALNIGLHAARLQGEDRRLRRMSLGVADDKTVVVAFIGDAPQQNDTLRNVTAILLAAASGRDCRALFSPRADRLATACDLANRLDEGHRVLVDPRADEPWLALGACDLVVCDGAGLALAWALTAARPTILCSCSAPGPADRAALVHLPDPSPADLAAALRNLLADPAHAADLAAAAGRVAAARFALEPFVERLTAFCHDPEARCTAASRPDLPAPATARRA